MSDISMIYAIFCCLIFQNFNFQENYLKNFYKQIYRNFYSGNDAPNDSEVALQTERADFYSSEKPFTLKNKY